jgi:integrase
MTLRKSTTHTVIANEVIVTTRSRSSKWQCVYKVGNKWQRTTTGERDLNLAEEKAKQIFYKSQARIEIDYTPVTRKFRDVANVVLKQLHKDFVAGNNISIYKDYTQVIERYLIPILGKYNVDSINYEVLELLDAKRAERMEKVPTKSTLMTHNAALNRIFDEAIYRGYMVASKKPSLKVKGKAGERREEFTVDEIRAMKAHYNKFIESGRLDNQTLRALFCDYIEILLDTGARPGDELLDLKWSDITTQMYPTITKTGEIIETNEDGNDNEELTIVNPNNTAFLNITTGKNAKHRGARFAAGREETVDALKRIARRNYDLRLSDAIKKKAKDYVFMFKEFKSKKRGNLNAPDKLLRPTSFRRLFDTFLTELNLLYTAKGKKRQLYSLRHTYATIMLVHDAVSAHTLAKQMGTSIGMIEKHYSKLDAVRAIAQLRGEESRQLINSKSDWSLTE